MAETKNYVLGKGKLFFDPFTVDTTNTTGERYLGNTTEFNMTVESEVLDHFSSSAGVRTKDDSVILELNRTGTLTTDNISSENTGLFILGTVSTITQTSTPVAGESLGTPLADRYYQLGQSQANPTGVRGVSAVTVTFDPNGTPSAGVLNTDYTIDLALGRVYFIEGGQADGATEVEVDYTPDANTRERVTADSTKSVEGALRFVAANAKGSQKDVYIPYVTLTPTGDLGFIGEDWQNMSMSVEVGELDGYAAMYIDGRPV